MKISRQRKSELNRNKYSPIKIELKDRESIKLKALEGGKLKKTELEAARKVIVRHTKKQGKFKIEKTNRIPTYKNNNESRMGKGKGAYNQDIIKVRKGDIIFSIQTSYARSKNRAILSLRKASKKLSIITETIK